MAAGLGFYQTVDGGRSWTPYPLGGQFELHNWPLFLNRETGIYIYQWELRRSTDGGRTSQKVTTPFPDKTDRIAMGVLAVGQATQTGIKEAWLAMQNITCMNPECPALLINSKDGGATWQESG